MDKATHARYFLDTARAGQIAEARAMVTATAVHHNMYFGSDMRVLIDAIAAASVEFPESTFTPQKTVTEGNMVVMHSHVTHHLGEAGMAVFQMFRFEGDLIAELWDVGQSIIADSPNKAGMF